MANAVRVAVRGERALPTGTVTFLMSDIEGSTRLLTEHADLYPGLLDRHRQLLRAAAFDESGVEVDATGDATFFVFSTAAAAVRAAVAAQRTLVAEQWPAGTGVRVRMGIHTGAGTMGVEGYVGVDVHTAARVAAAANGGQTICSDVVRALVESELDGLV